MVEGAKSAQETPEGRPSFKGAEVVAGSIIWIGIKVYDSVTSDHIVPFQAGRVLLGAVLFGLWMAIWWWLYRSLVWARNRRKANRQPE